MMYEIGNWKIYS